MTSPLLKKMHGVATERENESVPPPGHVVPSVYDDGTQAGPRKKYFLFHLFYSVFLTYFCLHTKVIENNLKMN